MSGGESGEVPEPDPRRIGERGALTFFGCIGVAAATVFICTGGMCVSAGLGDGSRPEITTGLIMVGLGLALVMLANKARRR